MTFQAFPIIFEDLHGFNYQCTGLAFLGMGLGMVIGLATQPLWNKYDSVSTGIFIEYLIYCYEENTGAWRRNAKVISSQKVDC